MSRAEFAAEGVCFEPVSPWLSAPDDLQPPLGGDLRCDVAVIGGGYTGLSTALALRAQGAEVAVLERDFAGSGASGRNAGHLTPTIGKDLPTLLRFFGRERAAGLVRFADRAVRHTEALIARHEIDCDYEPVGNLLAAVDGRQEAALRRAAEAGASLGAHLRFVPGEELRKRDVPAAFQSAVLEEEGGILDPGRYVAGLRAAALARGARLYEDTPVLAVEDGAPLRVWTAQGIVTADALVLATNAYRPPWPALRRLVTPLRVELFETEVLDADQREALGWRGREGVYTAHEILESYRLTARGTIVGGSKRVRYRYGSELAGGDAVHPETLALHERAFRDRFPEVGTLPIARTWGGWIGFGLDFLPILGATGARANVHYGLGFAGHGLAQASLMGDLLAEHVAGRRHPEAAALQRRVWRWPPEPARWLGYRALTAALEWVDHRTDRRVRSRSASPGSPRV